MKKSGLILGVIASVGVMLCSSVHGANWTYSGYTEGFYGYSSSSGSSKLYPFIYSYPDTNGLRLNHAQMELNYNSEDWFGHAGIHTGRYVEENYAAEPAFLRSIYTASIGKRFSSLLSLEAGVFTSHIGLESAIGKDNWTLSRSVMADNSPYFESGVKLNVVPNDTVSVSFLVLNGWQNISDTNDNKAFGTQIQWKPNPSFLLNSSTFIGNEQPAGSPSKQRYFHDLYAVIALSDSWSLAPVLDMGIQENGSGGWDSWGGVAVLNQWKMHPSWRLGARLEYFSDPAHVVSSGADAVLSASINSDHVVADHLLWRNELKTYWNLPTSSTTFLTSLSWAFEGGF